MATEQIPTKQKAWKVVGRDVPRKALQFFEDAEVPSKLKEGDVLIKVQAAALNPAGHKVMKLAPSFVLKRPYIPENDFAGIVVDANGTDLRNGDEVFGVVSETTMMKEQMGSLAEYIRLPATSVTLRPANISPVEAAGLMVAAMTAYHILFKQVQLQPGMSIFINGGSTAVGIFATQIAKATGCTVTASASTGREEFLKSIGVDHFIDYTKGPIHTQLEASPPTPKFHAFIEAVGNIDLEMYTHSPAYLAPGALFISLGPLPETKSGIPRLMRYMFEAHMRPSWLGGTPRKWSLVKVDPSPEDMKDLAQYFADGKVKPVVDSVFAFEDTLKAYDRIMTKHACGKVVVKVIPDVI